MARAAEPFVDAPVGPKPPVGAAAPQQEQEQAARRFPGVARMAGLAKLLVPLADVPVDAAVAEVAQAARRFPGVARMAGLAKLLVPLAGVPVGAAVPEVAHAGRRFAGVAGVAGLANLFVAASTGAAEAYPRFYSLESDPACLTPASSSEAGAKAGPAVGAACNGAKSATPITP
jgi:hypothetical protein